MSDFDDSLVQPEVVEDQPTQMAVVPQSDDIYKKLTDALSKRLDAIANKPYKTKVEVKSANTSDPLAMSVNITTNDPRVIAALNSSII